MQDESWKNTLKIYEEKAKAAVRGQAEPHVPVLHLDLKHMLDELHELERIRRFFKPKPAVQNVTNVFWILQESNTEGYLVRLVLKTDSDHFTQATESEVFATAEEARSLLRTRGLVRHEIGEAPLLELWFPFNQRLV